MDDVAVFMASLAKSPFFPFHSIEFVRCFFFVVAYSFRLNPELSSIIKIDGKKENIDACLPYTQYHSVDSCSQRATHDTQQPNHNCSSKWNDPCVNKSVANQVCSIYYIKVRLNSFKYTITLAHAHRRAHECQMYERQMSTDREFIKELFVIKYIDWMLNEIPGAINQTWQIGSAVHLK